MTGIHLTDDEIQQYALDKSGCEAYRIAHIEECGACKSRIAAYQLLFTGIQQQPEPVFDFNLEEMVMAQLPQSKTKFLPGNFYSWLFILAGIVLTGVTLYIFRRYVTGLFEGIAPLAIYLIATTIIIISIALSLDMYKNYQKKMKALNFY